MGVLTAFGPFVTDMYLPTLPSMTEYFSTGMSQVQLGLTFSMLGLALGQLGFGPLSDKIGRRHPLLISMAVFVVSTLACIFAPNIEFFLGMRFLQGIAGAGGIVIARSIAADKFSGRDLAKALAIVGAINGVAPVAAPIIGGVCCDFIGWRGIFAILLVLGLVIGLMCFFYKETLEENRRSKEKWSSVLKMFSTVIKKKRFISYVLQMAAAQGILFGNIASSPFLIQNLHHKSALVFSELNKESGPHLFFRALSKTLSKYSFISSEFIFPCALNFCIPFAKVFVPCFNVLAPFVNVNDPLYNLFTPVSNFVKP